MSPSLSSTVICHYFPPLLLLFVNVVHNVPKLNNVHMQTQYPNTTKEPNPPPPPWTFHSSSQPPCLANISIPELSTLVAPFQLWQKWDATSNSWLQYPCSTDAVRISYHHAVVGWPSLPLYPPFVVPSPHNNPPPVAGWCSLSVGRWIRWRHCQRSTNI